MGRSDGEMRFSVVLLLRLAARELADETNEVHTSEPGGRGKTKK